MVLKIHSFPNSFLPREELLDLPHQQRDVNEKESSLKTITSLALGLQPGGIWGSQSGWPAVQPL